MNPDAIWCWVAMGICPGCFTGMLLPDYRFSQGVNIGIDVAVGVVGAFAAGWLGDKFGVAIGPGVIPEFVNAIVGAVVLVGAERMIRRGG